ncbi:helix-turn-helix transcriptional regulator [Azohydromonas australica]|uniref:helix-turn-helix transcriptional regulator n=1 Tax=Azohydromonas australica TaxID=364039 RepID=UPI000404F468|nr:YafY family protein [Azohydromonas australica]
MSRSERLLDLLQLLRRHRRPVGGAALAQELNISLRTLYRDIATLQAQGAGIDGAPGLGYVLREGFTLPPLMFSVEEIEALVLGSRWVMERGDARLATAARDLLAKVGAVLPPPLRRELDDNALLAGPGAPLQDSGQHLAALREAIRQERRLELGYRDAGGRTSTRTVWPFALGFFDQVQVLVAWCELREDIRHFRTDRIDALQLLAERYPRRRQALLQDWREREGVRQA